MGNKKDIGSVFRKKLDHLETLPNDRGWAAIQTELDKKEKKRRILPLWFWYVGLFSVGLLVSGLVYTNSISRNNLLKFEDKTSKKPTNNSNENNLIYKTKTSDNGEKIAPDSEKNSTQEISNQNSEVVNNDTKNGNKELIISEKSSENNFKTNENLYPKKQPKQSKNQKTTQSKASKSYVSKSKFDKNIISKIKKRITKNQSKSKLIASNSNTFLSKKVVKNNNNQKNSDENLISQNSKIIQAENQPKQEFQNTIIDSKQQIANEKSIAKDSIKKKRIVAEKPKDSIPVIEPYNQTYTIFLYGSPTALATTNKNSFLDDRLVDYSKTSKISLSYGAYLCFEGSEKFSIRIGVNKNNLKLLTKNIPINTFNYSNIGYSNGFSNAVIFSKSNNASTMNITQNLSYYDVPVEMKYKIMNRKIGLNVIIGANFNFLDKNEIFVETDSGFKNSIGQTSNLLEKTLGASLGLGLDYKITKKIKINLEPMLKYQFKNSQINNSSLFNFNILTGIEFKIFEKK